MTQEILYINPSHQHSNIGVKNYGTEAQRAYEVACLAKEYADSLGVFKAVYVAPFGMTLSESIADSNAKHATIHVDIHTDANGAISMRGCTAFYKSVEGKKLATYIYNAVSALTPTTDRGVQYRDNLGCINQTHATAMLIELMFHSNPDDVAFILSHENDLAVAVIKGVMNYCGIVTPVAPAQPVQPIPRPINYELRDLQICMNQSLYRDKYGRTLVEDGRYGALTDSALQRVIIRRGDRGVLIGWMQKQLGINIDNIYGAAPYHGTYDALRAFQKKYGLSVDGVAGYKTIKKMLEV
jgi:hypothetical protein